MKNIITTLFAIFICLSSVFTQTVTIGETTYNTITEALEASIDNDVIEITGTHTEAISITKNVTLRGTDPATDIIQAAADQASATARVVFIDGNAGATTVTLENLTIRHGKAANHGGGILADKVKDLLTLRNVIISTNTTERNGGGINTGGSNVNFEDCTIENNTATGTGNVGQGGGIFITPNNAAGIDAVVNVKNTVIYNNESTNLRGGGFFINGNHQYGDQYTITANFENVTIINNHSPIIGGAGFILGVDYTGSNGDVAVGETNVTFNMVHCTVAYNTSDDVAQSGLTFGNGNAVTGPHFSLYNSIVVSADDVSEIAINFENSNTHDVINCMLGGLNAAPALIDENAKNNVTGKTSTFAGLATDLTEEGGIVKVLALMEDANSIDFCTAETGITLPAIDARGYDRDEIPDAGAYEYVSVTALNEISMESSILLYPNPAITSFKIDAEKQVVSISLYDISGKLIKQVFNNSEMDVADVKPGLYLVKVKAGSAAFMSKLLIK